MADPLETFCVTQVENHIVRKYIKNVIHYQALHSSCSVLIRPLT